MLREFVTHLSAAAAGDYVAAPGFENRFGRKSTLLVIIDDHYKSPGQHRILGASGYRQHLPELIGAGDRQPDTKHGPATQRGSCGQRVAQECCSASVDGESKAAPLGSFPIHASQLIELLEN